MTRWVSSDRRALYVKLTVHIAPAAPPQLFKSLHSLIKSYIDQQKILHIQVDILKELGEELRGAGVEGVVSHVIDFEGGFAGGLIIGWQHDMQGMFQKRLHERSTEYQGLSDRLKCE